METKKANHANLEKRRPFFIQMGFIITLALVLMAFEWAVEQRATKVFDGISQIPDEVDMINTFRKEPDKKIERPKPKITQIFELIDDGMDDPKDELDWSSESDEKDKITINVRLDDETGDSDIFFEVVEDMPIFRPNINKTKEQGDVDLHGYVMKKARYPEMARENGISGRVFVKFIVDEKGKVTNVAIERGIHPLLDNDALRVVRQLPNFSPGLQRGKAVRVLYRVPMNFRLG
jgi:protein TonB